MTVQDLENLKPGDIPHIDLEAMPVFTDVTFRIPIDIGKDFNHEGKYKAVAIPVDLPEGHHGYGLYIMRQDENKHFSILWSETIKLKDGGFVLSNAEAEITENVSAIASYYIRHSASPFVLRLKVSVLRETPEKLNIKLLGPFSGE
jgi:hypothetical protein|nr:MAG TPA: hypothetical protein [Caudoviricetes sp.]